MLKPVIAAAAIFAIAGSSIVYAQQRYGEHHGFGPRAEHHHRPSAADMSAFTDARIAALKAGLELTPDQAKNWPAFEQALRDMVKLRMERMQARYAHREAANPQPGQPPQAAQTPQQGQTPRNPFNRLDRRAESLAKTSAALKQVAQTGAPLYQSLTDEQKARFKTLARMLRPHQRRMAFNEGQGRQGPGEWRHNGRGLGRDGEHGGQRFGHQHRRFGENGPGYGMPGATDQGDDQGSQL